ncbi:hypothetical protein V2G26_009217 [Clonostachys chloroleuca]
MAPGSLSPEHMKKVFAEQGIAVPQAVPGSAFGNSSFFLTWRAEIIAGPPSPSVCMTSPFFKTSEPSPRRKSTGYSVLSPDGPGQPTPTKEICTIFREWTAAPCRHGHTVKHLFMNYP